MIASLQQVRDAVARLSAAILVQDRAVLDEVIADDFVGIGYSGATVGKQAYVDVHVDPAQGEGAFTVADVTELNLIERADTIVAHGVQHFKAKVDLTSRFVHLWRAEAGAVRCFFYQETPIAPEPSSPQALTSQLTAIRTRVGEAVRRRDGDEIDRNLAVDFHATGWTGGEADRDMFKQVHFAAEHDFRRFAPVETSGRALGDNIALLTGVMEVEDANNGRGLDRQRFTAVYRRAEGAWLETAYQESLNPGG